MKSKREIEAGFDLSLHPPDPAGVKLQRAQGSELCIEADFCAAPACLAHTVLAKVAQHSAQATDN